MVVEPPQGPNRAREAARNASSGFRRRLRIFLSSDAIRVLQAGGRAWLLGAAGFAAGVLLIVTEFTHLAYVQTITASCSDLSTTSLRDSCLTVGHESHHWAFALLGLFVIIMTFGATAGGSRPAAVALLVAGALGLGITLLHDLPDTGKKGEVGVAFARAEAHKGTGFWLELVGSSLALVCGAAATWRTPPRRRERRPRAPEAEDPATA